MFLNTVVVINGEHCNVYHNVGHLYCKIAIIELIHMLNKNCVAYQNVSLRKINSTSNKSLAAVWYTDTPLLPLPILLPLPMHYVFQYNHLKYDKEMTNMPETCGFCRFLLVCHEQTDCVAWLPRKHETSTQCYTNVGPPSTTLARHWYNIGSMSRICWLWNPGRFVIAERPES